MIVYQQQWDSQVSLDKKNTVIVVRNLKVLFFFPLRNFSGESYGLKMSSWIHI